jgi:hypothetical protein
MNRTGTSAAIRLGLAMLLGVAGCGRNKAEPAREARAPEPGTVAIVSVPKGAAVFDESQRRLGSTPLTLKQPGGTRMQLQVVKDGHTSRYLTAQFESGRRQQLEITLSPRQAELLVTCAPIKGAHIFVDGEPQGLTPQRIAVSAGVEHLVEVRKEGLVSYQETVKLRPGERRQVLALLQHSGSPVPMGVLVVRVNAPATVYLDGKLIGRAPLPPLPLPARAHLLRIKAESGASQRRRVLLKKGQRLELFVDLRKDR